MIEVTYIYTLCERRVTTILEIIIHLLIIGTLLSILPPPPFFKSFEGGPSLVVNYRSILFFFAS
jgi:hypothetical protein